MQRNTKIPAGTPVLVNGEKNRVIPYLPPAPGREPHSERSSAFARTADGWAKSMAIHYEEVCAPHLWRIHGELYDLEKYLDTHPGGRIWLEQTRGSDCTESFECHHVRGVPKSILDKYRVKDQPTPKQGFVERYTYDENFAAIKKCVAATLEKKIKNPTGSTPTWAGMIYLAIVLQFLLVARYAARRKSYPLAMLAGFLLTGCWGVGHTQVHRGRKSFWNFLRYAMDLTGFSAYETTVTHAISHHQNPNTFYDVEVYAFQDVDVTMLTNEPKNSAWPYRYGLFHLITTVTAPTMITMRLIQRVINRKLFQADVFIPLGLVAMMSKEAGSFSKGFKLALTMWLTFSGYFIPMSLTVHHAYNEDTGAPACYHDGEPDMQRDFAAHQIVSTLDHSRGLNTYWSNVLFAGLNVHTVHHMFPTIDRVYHEIILDELLEKNPGNFRQLYGLRDKQNKRFVDLVFGMFKFVKHRRFEPVLEEQ